MSAKTTPRTAPLQETLARTLTLPPEAAHAMPAQYYTSAELLEREIDAKPPTNVARWVPVKSERGPAIALTFVADARGPAYAGRLPLEEVASITARAAGHWGSSAAYLQRTVAKLEEHGIRDRNLWRLQRLVAEHILSAHPEQAVAR